MGKRSKTLGKTHPALSPCGSRGAGDLREDGTVPQTPPGLGKEGALPGTLHLHQHSGVSWLGPCHLLPTSPSIPVSLGSGNSPHRTWGCRSLCHWLPQGTRAPPLCPRARGDAGWATWGETWALLTRIPPVPEAPPAETLHLQDVDGTIRGQSFRLSFKWDLCTLSQGKAALSSSNH